MPTLTDTKTLARAVWLVLLIAQVSATCPDEDAVLALANEFRIRHSSSPLVWDASIATAAQAHARQLAAGACGLSHSDDADLGESLYHEFYTPARMEPQSCVPAVQSWYNEVDSYRFTATPWADNQQSFQDVGDFTQLVWASTSNIGCGMAQAPDFSCHVVVCQFYIPGNVADDDYFLQNVLPIQESSEESSAEFSASGSRRSATALTLPATAVAAIQPGSYGHATGSPSSGPVITGSSDALGEATSAQPADHQPGGSRDDTDAAKPAADAIQHPATSAGSGQKVMRRRWSLSRGVARRHLLERPSGCLHP
ncbi:CAP domain-containing protein [Haematococcus lacustris]